MALDTVGRLRLALRINHTKLDEDISADLDACLADLRLCGIIEPNPTDPLIFNAVKLFLRASYTDDTDKAAEYLRRYDALKASLMMAEGYGWREAGADV